MTGNFMPPGDSRLDVLKYASLTRMIGRQQGLQ
jgi:hypothetical protein